MVILNNCLFLSISNIFNNKFIIKNTFSKFKLYKIILKLNLLQIKLYESYTDF